MKRSWLLVALCLGCGPKLTRTMIVNHPKLSLEAMKPQIVESSAPIRPRWIHRLDRGAVDFVPFTGQAYAPTLEEAKAGAQRDLVASVASYVAVDVASEIEVKDSERTAGGRTESSSEVTQTTRTRAAASLSGVRADEVFWEKVLVSPLVPDRHAYRVFVHARVKRAVITKARLAKQLARQKQTGRRMLVVLPFRSTTPAPEAKAIERAFAEELSRRLGAGEKLFVGDPGMVDGLVGASPSEAEALQTIREALLPDLVVGGSYQLHEGRVKVTYTLYDAEKALRSGTATQPWTKLFELQDELATEIAAAVGSAKKQTKLAPPNPKALELFWAAYEKYRAGDNDAAIGLLTRAIAMDPDEPRLHLRLGRVLERLGRYGRSRPQRVDPWAPQSIEICTPWYLVSPQEPSEFLQSAVNEPTSADTSRGAYLGDIASAVTYVQAGGPLPVPDVPAVAVSAIGAYWNAYRLSRNADEKLRFEVRIAIADLLLRTGQLASARRMFEQIANEAGLAGDLHHEGLALLGLGRAMRQAGELDRARGILQNAAKVRRRTLERPYLLEIENELGQLEVEASRYRKAAAHYTEALRIAEDLDDDYFRAVLGNNLGVLETLAGRADRAEAFFHRAWRALTDIDENEGRTATNLNIGYLNATRGDLEAARTYLLAARKIARSSRRAELLAQEGHLNGLRGHHLDALRALLMSFAIHDHAGRSSASWRQRANVVATELAAAISAGEVEERIWCIQSQARSLLNHPAARRRRGRDTVDFLQAFLTWTVARSLL